MADADDLGAATPTSVRDDGTLVLADGRLLRLAEIELPPGRDGRTARAAILDWAKGGVFTLKADGPAQDRFGRLVAQAYAADGTWIEEALLRQGLARVDTTTDHHAMAHDLLAAERAARSHRLGLWDNPDYALRTPGQAARLTDTWQIVEGMVVAARVTHGDIYLAFGEDRERDLAVRIPDAIAEELALDPDALVGRKLRVRGWIGKTIGPVIAIDHAEQIELGARARRVAAQ